MSGDQEIRGRSVRLRAPERQGEAEHAIDQALVLLSAVTPSVDQLADLADAIDSFKAGEFGLAAELAAGAQRRKVLPAARRPEALRRSLPDLKAAFESTRSFLRSHPLKGAS